MKDADTQRGFLGYPKGEWIVSLIILVLGTMLLCMFMLNEGMVKTVLMYFFAAVILFWLLSWFWSCFCGLLNLMGRLLDP